MMDSDPQTGVISPTSSSREFEKLDDGSRNASQDATQTMDSEPQTVVISPTSSSREIEKLEDGTGKAMQNTETEPAAAPPPPPSNPPPNGGFKAWLQVLGSWLLIFNTWGIVITFGAYQTFYETGKLFTQTPSNISWIGSLQALLVFTVGCIVGPIYDRGHLRFLLSTGTFCIVFGHMMLSLCMAYWEVLLAQGVVVGIGSGCLFVPAFAIVQPYFSSHLGLAVGIAATGSAAGGVIYPVIFTNLIDKVGFGWTVRVIGFVALATLVIPLSVSKIRIKSPGVRKLVDWEAFKDGPFMLYVFACLLGYTGVYTAFYYISFYGEAQGWMGTSMALYLVPILNAGSVLGRVAPNWLSDKIGPTNVLIPGAIMTGVLLLSNIAVHNSAGLIATTFFFGIFSGMFVATPVLLLIALTKDKRKLGTRMGMAFSMMGLGVLSGGPGSGGVLQRHPERLDWNGLWAYGGVFSVAAGLAFFVLRVWIGGWRLRVKV